MLARINLFVLSVATFILFFYFSLNVCLFAQRWPHLREAFDDIHNNAEETESTDWQHEVQERILCKKQLMEKLSQMSAKHYNKQELSAADTREYDPMFLPEYGARPMSYHYLVDELLMLIEQPVE